MANLIVHLIVAATTPGTKELSLSGLTQVASAGGMATFLSTVFAALGQLIKTHPRIPNHWLRWMIPMIALASVAGVIFAAIKTGYTIDPITFIVLVGAFLAGAGGAEVLYQASKVAPFLPTLPPGPDPPAPATGMGVAPPPGNGQPPMLPPSPHLPPSPNLPH